MLKYYKNLGIYKNSNGTNKVNKNINEAVSYNHWIYLKEINGKLVFNNYSYSISTCKHQNDCHKLYDYTFDIVVNTRLSLDKEGALLDALNNLNNENEQLTKLINSKRTKQSLNEYRQQRINDNKENIGKIIALIPNQVFKIAC